MEADYLREQESESAGARGFSQLVNGMNVYRVEVVRLKDRSADKVFEKLRRKISRGKTLGRHDFSVMIGYEDYYAFWENLDASRDQYQLTSYPYLDLGSEDYRDNGGNAEEYAYRSLFGRMTIAMQTAILSKQISAGWFFTFCIQLSLGQFSFRVTWLGNF